MSKFTTELRFLLAPTTTGFDIGLKDYPIYDENYRSVLNKAIIDHFYCREIGFETPEKFKFFLNRKMREIMPLYNQYFESTLIEFDPLKSYYLTEVYKKANDATSTGSGTSTGNVSSNEAATSASTQNADNLMVEQDTPQGLISRSDLQSNVYASKANHVSDDVDSTTNSASAGVQNSSTSGTSTSTMNTIEEYSHAVAGNRSMKSQSQLMIEFRKSFINVNQMIFDELDSCFMQVW